MTDLESADALERLKRRTSRDDRLDEKVEEDDDDDEVDYKPIDEVVLQKSAKKDVDALRRDTSRGERVEEDEQEEVELRPFEEFDFDFGEAAVDEPYCGNCAAISFEKHRGKPRPECGVHDCPTSLKPGHVCGEYVPQGLEAEVED